LDRQHALSALADAVLHLERVHAAGCTFGSLLSTRDREQFVSLTAEVLVADDFLRRGYEVQTVPRSDEVSPDLLVVVHGLDVAVEIYSPRELLAVDAWVKEVSDLLNYVDVKASYASSVQTKLEQQIPPDRTPLDPWAHAKMLDETGGAVLAQITRDVEDALAGLRPFAKSYRHDDTRLLTTIELEDVEEAPDAGPLRRGTIGYPGFSGYSPAGVFRRTVERSQRKARRRQTQGVPASARILVVYLMGSQIAKDLTHPAHLRQAEQALDGIDPRDYDLDAIAFVVRALPEGLAAILTVADDTILTTDQVKAMVGSAPT
jgi:hypothetical protein